MAKKQVKEFENIMLLGTSHISKDSVKRVKELIKSEDPDIIAIELDPQRLHALAHKQKGFPNPFRVGFKGMIFAILGQWAEKRMGNMVGVSPGTEMLTAARIAKRRKKRLAFIDQNIEITLKRLSQGLTWAEKWTFIKDLFKGFMGYGPKLEFDLRKVPENELIDTLLKRVRKSYPNVHRVLVEERNEVMANNLSALRDRFPEKRILAIVGAGHVDDILKLLDTPNISYEFSFQSFK